MSPATPPLRSIRNNSRLSTTLVPSKAAEVPSEAPIEVEVAEEAGMQHPRIVVVVTTAPVGAAASPAASRITEVRPEEVVEDRVALLEANIGHDGRRQTDPTIKTRIRILQVSSQSFHTLY